MTPPLPLAAHTPAERWRLIVGPLRGKTLERVEKGVRLVAPTGQKEKAQGNALGKIDPKLQSPEGATQQSLLLRGFAALRLISYVFLL